MTMSPSRWPTEMREVSSLTPEQDARLQDEVGDWLRRGRSAEPLDRDKAADSIRALYAAVGSPTPTVLFFSSPVMCILACQALRAKFWNGTKRHQPPNVQMEQDLRSQLHEQLASQSTPKRWPRWRRQADCSIRRHGASRSSLRCWAETWDQLSTHFDSRIDGRLGPWLRAQLESDLRAALWWQLRSRLWLPVELKLKHRLSRTARVPSMERAPSRGGEREWKLFEVMRDGALTEEVEVGIGMPALEVVRGQIATDIGGQAGTCAGAWWCASAVFYDYCGHLGMPYALEQKRLLRLWLDQCRQAHWWFECDGLVFVSDRPAVLQLDSHGRLHNERGPALDHGDGFQLCAIHGVHVEEHDVLHPQRITVKRIEKERNLEVRRVLTSLYGHARYLKDSGATLVHQDERGKLWRKKRADDADLVMVEVVNSTPEPDGSVRSYLLRVPPAMTTAAASVAWTFAMQSGHYQPRVET